MKKYFFSTLIAVCGSSIAANSYDGIFQERNQPNSYLSIHTSNNSFIGTIYNIDDLKGMPITLFDGIKPQQLNTWNLLSGSIYGNVANFSGEMELNTCKVTGEISFTKNIASLAIKSSSPTAVGEYNKVDCSKNFPIAQNIIFDKIFNKDADDINYSESLIINNPALSCVNQYSIQKVNISFNIKNNLDIPISQFGFNVQYFNSLAPIPLISEGVFYYDLVGGLAAGASQYLQLEPNMFSDFSVKAKKYCDYPGSHLTIQPIYFLDKEGKRHDLQ